MSADRAALQALAAISAEQTSHEFNQNGIQAA